jgi:DNA repair protein RadC
MKENGILNEIKVLYKANLTDEPLITSSNEAQLSLRKIFNKMKDQLSLKEYSYILLMNRANKIIGYYRLSEGGITGTVVDVRLAFSVALKCLASSIILCHNHPSGQLKPSEADISLTKKFIEAGKLLDIAVLDHIIITEQGYYSLADDGLI